MCKQLEISRSAYYKWLHRNVPDAELENIRLAELIKKKLGIHSEIRKKRKRYSYSMPEATGENKLSKDFYATALNQKWTTDVTEFKIRGGKGKLYLSIILDLYKFDLFHSQVPRRSKAMTA